MSRCGSKVKSSTIGSPIEVIPRLSGIASLFLSGHTKEIVSKNVTSLRTLLGTKTPTALSPGIRFTKTASTPNASAKSLASPSMWLIRVEPLGSKR